MDKKYNLLYNFFFKMFSFVAHFSVIEKKTKKSFKVVTLSLSHRHAFDYFPITEVFYSSLITLERDVWHNHTGPAGRLARVGR